VAEQDGAERPSHQRRGERRVEEQARLRCRQRAGLEVGDRRRQRHHGQVDVDHVDVEPRPRADEGPARASGRGAQRPPLLPGRDGHHPECHGHGGQRPRGGGAAPSPARAIRPRLVRAVRDGSSGPRRPAPT
jgi:hypothetical protein